MLPKRSALLLLKNNARTYASEAKSLKTPLYQLHVRNGGKLVDFSGFTLPVQYADLSVSASHLHTRKNASIFDVSHMLQTRITGKDSLEWFETLCPVDLHQMKDGSSALTVFLTEKGGILDDLIVTRVDSNNLYVVSNAGCIEGDKKHMIEQCEKFKKKNKDVSIDFYNVSNRGLIALQGPKAAETLQKLVKDDLSKMNFMTSREMNVAGIDTRVTRCGYTGEDGFEISASADKIEDVTEKLLESSDIKLAGLGARDSLRLEAGLCLYGNDIDTTVTPVEASLTWLIAKARRERSNFPGADIILKQIKDGVEKRRIGLRLETGAPARKGAILKKDGQEVGVVTSGCPSPSLGGNVAMGYVKDAFKKNGTKILANIRGKDVECAVTKMPFVPSNYYVNK